MITIDDYTAQGANQLTQALAGSDAALVLIASAIAGSAHFPANGARVIHGWADKSGNATWITDGPVLWFNAEGQPVVADSEVSVGVETLIRDHHRSNERWAVYHPDTSTVEGPEGSARDRAITEVEEALTEYVFRFKEETA